jgi:hypothetical protein
MPKKWLILPLPWQPRRVKWAIRRVLPFCHSPILAIQNHGQVSRRAAAVEILQSRDVGFEFDGEMTGDIALDYDLMKSRYPFCNLTWDQQIF